MFCWKSSSQPSSLIETTVIVSWCIHWVLRWTIQVVGTWLNWLSLYALHRSFARPELRYILIFALNSWKILHVNVVSIYNFWEISSTAATFSLTLVMVSIPLVTCSTMNYQNIWVLLNFEFYVVHNFVAPGSAMALM